MKKGEGGRPARLAERATDSVRTVPRKPALCSTLRAAAARLKKSQFVRNVAVMAGGTAAAQAITIGVLPVITRLYAPDALGLLGVFNSVVVLLTPLACLGYHIAIVIPKSDHDARGLVRLSLRLATGFSAVIAVLLVFTHAPLASVLGFGASGGYLLLIPVVVLTASVGGTLSQWLVRADRFWALQTVSVTHSGFKAGAKAALGFLWPTGIVLIAVNAVARVLKALWFLVVTRRDVWGPKPLRGDTHSMTDTRRLAREYRDFPTYQLPKALAARLGEAAPTLVLTALFGPAFAGFYALAHLIVKLPSKLMAQSISKVYRSRAAKMVHAGNNVSRDIARTTAVLLLLGVVPYGVIIGSGPPIFALIFGADWVVAGHAARWLAVWYVFHVAVSPGSQALIVTRHLPFRLMWTVSANGAKIGALAAGGIVTGDPIAAIAAYAMASIGADVVLVLAALWKTRPMAGERSPRDS